MTGHGGTTISKPVATKTKFGRNKIQASRNKIQMALSSNKRDFSMS
jgi:hypothetical protein